MKKNFEKNHERRVAPKVLIIDNDAHLSGMLTRLLENRGYSPLRAVNTETALKTLSLVRVDAVLLDVVLGRENGWETLRRMREVSPVPIVLMTGVGVDEEMRGDATQLGAQGVLQKPFETADLIKLLGRLAPT